MKLAIVKTAKPQLTGVRAELVQRVAAHEAAMSAVALAFITAYNHDAHPFQWTKQVVFSRHPRSSYAYLYNYHRLSPLPIRKLPLRSGKVGRP